MVLSSTQHSPSIFSLHATICPRKKAKNATIGQNSRHANQHSNSVDWPIIPVVLVLPSFGILILSYSNFSLLKVPTQQDFSKFTLIVELGAFGHASFILKRKKKKKSR